MVSKNLFYGCCSILILLFIASMLILASVAMERDTLAVKLKQANERIEDQAILIDLQAADAVSLETAEKKIRRLEGKILTMERNLGALAALEPLLGVLTWDEIIALLEEIPHANLFENYWQVSANFGESVGYHGRYRINHEGLDMISGERRIRPLAEGEVVDIGIDDIYGKYLTIQHSERVRTFYAHAEKIYYAADMGMHVMPDTIIMLMGNTGQVYSSVGNDGTHLHFELQIKVEDEWISVDPRPFMLRS